jgi:hypothetical protein
MTKQLSKPKLKILINELACETCESDYCFLKTFLEIIHPEPKVLIQLKCLEYFKWDMNVDSSEELDMNDVAIVWAETGWAKVFSDVFDEELTSKQVYKLVKDIMAKE